MSTLADSVTARPRPARLILMLSLAPTISLGIGRFAYSLVLPDMRDTLGWSYSAAGFMNTVNAAGYLAGALLAARLVGDSGCRRWCRRARWPASPRWRCARCPGNFIVLGFARLLAGVGAAVAFVAGGALAATIAQSAAGARRLPAQPVLCRARARHPVSGLIAPFLLQALGPGSWWIGVAGRGGARRRHDAAAAAGAASMRAASRNAGGPGAIRDRARSLIYLAGYFLFGAGYIAYMTFMIAYVRDAGGGAAAQSAFWCLIGISAFASPWVWRRRARARPRRHDHRDHPRRQRHRRGAADLSGTRLLLALSALVFGVAFFAVVGSTTAFVRFNYPPAAWPTAIAAMTIVVRHRPDAGPDRGRRDHRRDRQPAFGAERLGGDAGARRGAGGVSEDSWRRKS